MASVPATVLYRIGDLELDLAKGSLCRGGREIHLKPKAFQILAYLIAQRDRLVSRDELLEQFWKDTAIGEDVLAHSIAELRRALGDSSRAPLYLKTVPKRGYLFVADVQEVSCEAFAATEEITTIQVREEYSDEFPARRFPRWAFAITAATVALAFVAIVGALHYWPARSPNTPEPSLRAAIIPFENRSGRADMDWLRVGLADMLATSLSASPRISLITPQQLERVLRHSSTAHISFEDALRDARQAGAAAMIMGAYASLGDAVRVDTQIYDVHSGLLSGGESLTVQKSEFLLAQLDSLSYKIAARLGAPLLSQTRLAEVMTNNLEAYRLYSLGLARTRDVRLPEAISLFEQAAKLDPAFAMAYARIGFTYSSTWGRSAEGKPYLEKAYRLSDRLTPRDRLFIRAWYMCASQDYEAAERAYRQILSAFPLEVEAYFALGTLLAGDGRYAEARRILERGLTIEPDMPQLHNKLSMAYLDLGETQKGLDSAQRYVASSGEPNAFDTLAAAYQR
ncbi:MAG TPA: winged helix-turn-helix domain-containing protein, partial [Capsulimonadaceae bacterium]|nr:winged helix-turn-helix domain-containing protein [Capsulimonadaceae bacterium]